MSDVGGAAPLWSLHLPVPWWKLDFSSGKGGVPWGKRPGFALAARNGVRVRVPETAVLGCCGAGKSRDPAHLEQQHLKGCVRLTGASCGLRPAVLQPYWGPRPGRAFRGFHGDGKQVSTASTTTAKCPGFHPPLGVQRDHRGAGCEVERERGDSEAEVNNRRRCTWRFPRAFCVFKRRVELGSFGCKPRSLDVNRNRPCFPQRTICTYQECLRLLDLPLVL